MKNLVYKAPFPSAENIVPPIFTAARRIREIPVICQRVRNSMQHRFRDSARSLSNLPINRLKLFKHSPALEKQIFSLRIQLSNVYLHLIGMTLQALISIPHNLLSTIGVSSRPKRTGVVRGKAFLHVFAQTSDRLPRLTQTYPIMPDVMDMIESDID
ncbi:hypothetical protein TNCV_983331 [Trichonephila clavipes]|nr:hypothetical protein TNCV_983331 [Trichonephila clavipes]